MWKGKVKHRLKTAEGASTVELFSISALVPEKLIEQMPPTLFVSALAGGLSFAGPDPFRLLHALCTVKNLTLHPCCEHCLC